MPEAHPPPDESLPPDPHPDRRRFVAWLSIVLGAMASCAVGIPIVGYLFAPLIQRKPDRWVRLGPAGRFRDGATQVVDFSHPYTQPWDGMVARTAAYVRREGDDFRVFSVHCAHLGCPVTWFPESGLFMCPCHGGVYYQDGRRASGPPPRGLFRYRHRVRAGQLEILAGHMPLLHDPPEDEPAGGGRT
jgi:nitrite reductase/ring-hydroxylating ferredoxin subunit